MAIGYGVFMIGGRMNKIIALDENQVVLTVLADELAEDGFEVVRTENSDDFLGLVEEGPPRLAIMEIDLKTCDGLELLQTLRYRHYDLPIIIWSISPWDCRDVRILAADHHVLKRPDFQELKHKIRLALEASEPMSGQQYSNMQTAFSTTSWGHDSVGNH